ncbi:MAG: MBL fold metallo-hydrolase [Anaerolineae bacterium]|nr:MBL fold metallo-hydrolase [Anaerolineae bacterium]
MTVETYHFNVGNFNGVAINDGYIGTISAAKFFDGASPGELRAELGRYGLKPGKLRIPAIILYVDMGTQRVLIDTGGGPNAHPGCGLLMEGLRVEGIAPEDVTIVALSHGHWDHVAGNLLADGSLAFPNARYVMARAEYDYWLSELAANPTSMVYRSLDAIRDHLDLIDPDAEIVPGFRAIAAPGHTFHHTAFAFESGGETLYCLIDTIDHPLHFEHIRWTPNWDDEPAQSVETRRTMFDRVSREGALLHGFHLPFPGLGQLKVIETDSWQLQPLGK